VTGAERRAQLTADIAEKTGITEATIERLVRGFYAPTRCWRRSSKRESGIGSLAPLQ
jgi:hypothetical protein